MKKLILLTVGILVFTSVNLFAETRVEQTLEDSQIPLEDQIFQLDISEQAPDLKSYSLVENFKQNLAKEIKPEPTVGIGDIVSIINIGLKIWEIIEANKPVVSVNFHRVSAFPAGLKHWSEMLGWSDIQVKEYHATYVNGYNAEVVKIEYILTYCYGGKFEGRGNYLSQVGVIVKNLEASWGFSVDAQVEVPRVINIGTQENPEALMEMNLKWSVGSIIKRIHESLNFKIYGTGKVETLN